MTFRRRRFKTAFLAALVHPVPLLEALKELCERGDLEWFEYGKYNCIIKLTKSSGLAMMLEEASKPVVNPRPFVRNKNANIRKTKT
jgi:hypothetical protein